MHECHTLREVCGINFILADRSIQWEEFQLSTIFLKMKMDFFKRVCRELVLAIPLCVIHIRERGTTCTQRGLEEITALQIIPFLEP